MRVEVRQSELRETGVDLLVVGLFEGEAEPAGIGPVRGAEKARAAFKKLTLLHPDDPQWLLIVGLGDRDELDAERLRVAGALAAKEAGRLEATSLAWALPDGFDASAGANALVTGTILASYRFDHFKSGDGDDSPRLESLTLLGPDEVAGVAEEARIAAEAQNRARELQST
ncbi:MAG TPA: M17 family peptidase N-terminal domain-containing protein, partial [Solirubrobacterales bacterium]|nr:M17 family peptidase N-terminal domain-containing protein [Solirubrobacterales bacterium]